MAKRLTPTKIRKIHRLSAAGHTTAAISKMTGHTWDTVNKTLLNGTTVTAEEVPQRSTSETTSDPLRDVLRSNLTATTKVRLATLLLENRG